MKLHYSFKSGLRLLVPIALLTLSYMGCVARNENPAISTTNETLYASDTPSAIASPIATATVTIMPTFTPMLSTLTTTLSSTLLPTVASTWTPAPTLPSDLALETLLALYNDNGGCELPCWWGITPGETSWAEARTKLAPLGWMSEPQGKEKTVRYEFVFDVPEMLDTLEYIGPTLGVREGIVVGISLNSHWIKPDFDYSLAGLLQAFGLPDEIWVKVVTDTQYEPHYEMVIFYATRGTLLKASGIIQEQDTHLMICPQEFRLDSFPPALILWDPSARLGYQAVSYSVMGWKATDSPDFHLLEELSADFDRQDFYETYLDPQNMVCFNIMPINRP